MTIAVLFPGQGSQVAGMGHDWKGRAEWEVVVRAEDAVGASLGHLLLDDDLATTRAAQVAVLLASLMAWEAARGQLGDGAAFAGHSLGQVTALIAAGVVSFDDGLRFAVRRAEITQEAAHARPGSMAALLGASSETAASAVAAAAGSCWVANDNAPGQIVVAGTHTGVATAAEAARALGVRRVTPLDVAAAFHTPLMADAAAALQAEVGKLAFHPPSAPVVSNDDAVAYADAEGWRDRLAVHVIRPVRWRASMETIVALGVTHFAEVGPGGTLAALAKRCAPDLVAVAP